MTAATKATLKKLMSRSQRLEHFIRHKLLGEAVPDKLIDDVAKLVDESVKRYRSERAAGSN